jgi:ParB family chromosome partitioning protein
MTQEALAQRLGKERSTIANMLRLLKLPQIIQKDLIEERLSMGHARVLAGLKSPMEQKRVREIIIKKALSVRQLEELVKIRDVTRQPKKKKTEQEYYFQSLIENLKRSLGTKVDIKKRGKQGYIVIHFFSDEELDRILELLT